MNNNEYIKCPECKTKIDYKGDGKYKCPKCKSIFKSEENPTQAGKDFGKYRSPIKEDINKDEKFVESTVKQIIKNLSVKTNVGVLQQIRPFDLSKAKKMLDGVKPSDVKISMEDWQRVGSMVNKEVERRKKLGQMKESDMRTSSRIERMIMKEEITDQKVEAPLQSTGSTPEPPKSNSSMPPAKNEPPMGSEPQKPESNQPHTDFMEAVKPTMEKVKANQIVTWEELKKLSELFDKIVK